MSNIHKLLLPLGILCSQAFGASPVLINGNFDAFELDTGVYAGQYDATTNPNGYTSNLGGFGAYNYRDDAAGIGWLVDTADKVIELWKPVNGYNFVSTGGQFAELNAQSNGALFQDVTIAALGDVDYGFSHAAREPNSTDIMRVLITYLGADNTFGTADDLVKVNTQFSSINTSPALNWNSYAVDNAFTSVAGGTYRFSFGAVSSGGVVESGLGNFLDNVRFGINAVPEPSAALLGSLGALALLRRRRR